MNEQALIDAILAAPDEDAPRLVYADYLAEQEDPSAEVIGLEVAQAREVPDSPAWRDLERRLVGPRERAADLEVAPGVRLERVRGLVERVLGSVGEVAAHAAGLFARHPFLCRLELWSYASDDDERVLGPAWRDRLVEVVCVGLIGHHAARLPRLRDLRIAGLSALPGELLRDTRLRSLRVTHGPWAEAQVRQLLGAGTLGGLASFGITHSGLGVAGCATLAKLAPPTLRRLALNFNDVGHMSLAPILQSLRALEALELEHTKLAERGFELLVRAAPPGLRELRLAHTRITDGSARILCGFPGELAVLDVRDSGLSDEARVAIRERFGDVVLL
jgi:uncharacterized protein (TIGR02996 family)